MVTNPTQRAEAWLAAPWYNDGSSPVRTITEAASIIRALLAERAWRPIAEAPRDGTHVILAFGQDHVSEGWWEDADPGPHPWKFIDAGCSGSAFANGEVLNGAREVRGGPTSFLPLPEPPKP